LDLSFKHQYMEMKKIRNLSEKEVFVASQYRKEEMYWLDKLSGNPVTSNFPYDHKKTGKDNEAGMNTAGFQLQGELFAKLMEITNGLDHRVHMFLAAALMILLGKYTGIHDIIFGTPIYKQEIEGEFINTVLILRNKLENNMSFRDVLLQVRQTLVEAVENQNYPLQALLCQLDNQEYLPGKECPLFDVVILLENIHDEKYLEGINPNIIFSFLKTDERVESVLKYNSLLYDGSTIERISTHFNNLLQEVVFNRNLRVDGLNILSREEKNQLLYDFNDTKQAYPKDMTIDTLFERQAAKKPDNISAVGKAPGLERKAQSKNGHHQIAHNTEEPSTRYCAITYKELNKKSHHLALHLRAKGVKADAVVGIMMMRSLEMIIGLLGILKAGGAYLPIAIQYPQERKKYMIKESNAKILLTNSPDLFDDDLQLIGMNLAEPGIYINENRYNIERTQKKHRFNSLAYVIYTSGSTGKPKGVMIEHRNVVRLVKNSNYIRFNEGERILQSGALEFDASTFEIWGALLNGLMLYLVSQEKILVPENLKNTIKKHNINTIWITSPLFNQLLEADIEIFSGLKNLLVGGDVVSTLHINRLRSRFPVLNIINGYGPTENTTFSTTYLIDRDYKERIPIGTPIANSNAYILDDGDNLQPVKVPGELCVGGDGAARGYLNNPALTEEKFKRVVISDSSLVIGSSSRPFPNNRYPITNDRLYRTGDLARWLPDGKIDFLGRQDSQVKISGFRVEPGEIEKRLLSHEKIKDAVLIVRESKEAEISPAVKSENKYLCAYYVPASSIMGPEPGEKIEVSQLKAHLLKELPGYMIPRYFIELEKIPLTINGKVDKKSLPEPESVDLVTGYTASRNEIEAKLTGIWSEVLGIKQETISIDDDFLSLGGHSLKAAVLVEKIQKIFNVKIPLPELFAIPFIKDLSKYIKEAKAHRSVPIELAEEKEYYALSAAQKRMYILHRLEIGSPGYNIPIVVALGGHINRKRVEDAFIKLIKRHESLRTSFEMIDTEPVQRIHREVSFKIDYFECSEEEADEIINRSIKPFDLSQPPILRVKLMKIGEARHIIIVDMHHIISDGTSLALFVNEFMKLYRGVMLSPLRVRYKDYSEWQNSEEQKETIKKQERYWQKEFEVEAPLLTLPTDYARPVLRSSEGNTTNFVVGPEETSQLKTLALKQESTMFMVLLAIFYVLLAKLSRQEDIVVGTGMEGRRHEDLRKVIGMFINTAALRCYPHAALTFPEFLRQVKKRTLNVFENQDYQFENLVEQTVVRRDTSRNPLFDVMFQLNDIGIQNVEIPGIRLKSHPYKRRVSKFDMTLFVKEPGKRLFFTFEYSTKLFNERTIQYFARYFKDIISSVLEDPDRTLGKIMQMPGGRKKKILSQLDKTLKNEVDFIENRNQILQTKLAENLKKCKDNIAIEYGNRNITYAELDKRSSGIARWILNRGIKPGTFIGILLDDRAVLIEIMIGILKSRCVFVPLDTSLPRKRLEEMMVPNGIRLIFTDHVYFYRYSLNKDCDSREQLPAFVLTDELSSKEELPGVDRQPAIGYSPEDKIYVYFTSGTTGTPVAILGKNKSLVHFIDWEIERLDVIHNTRISQLTTPGFDAFLRDVFVPLCAGGVICIPVKTGIMTDPAELKKWVNRCRIQLIHCVPSLFRLLIPGEGEEAAGNNYKNLKFILLSGEAINPLYLGKWYDAFKNRVQLVNLWGTTETTLAKTCYFIRESDGNRERIPVGKPIPGAGLLILNERQEICDAVVTGVIYIRTPFGTPGYLNSPELNSQRFIRSPFNHDVDDLMHKTGDLGRMLPDGNIDIIGRNDRQVKIRGIRVELEEIENILSNHPRVSEAVVVKKPISEHNELLCAYIIVIQEDAVKAEALLEKLKNYLGERLPGYMVPDKLIALEKMPRTPSGKIDYVNLTHPLPGEKSIYRPPGDNVEKKLLEIWTTILGIKDISITSNFFQLGGNSLNIMTLIARIHREFNVRISLANIFNNPTIEDQAVIIRKARSADYIDEYKYASIVPIEDKDYYPLSPSQERLYFLQQVNLQSTVYNMTKVMALAGETNKQKLERTFGKLIRRHESLRTSFEIDDGEPVQRIHQDVNFEIEYYEPGDGEELMPEPIIKHFIRPFDLSQAPLLRVGLIKLLHTPTALRGHLSQEGQENKYILMVDMHHIVSDGVSEVLLTNEFITQYRYPDQPLPGKNVRYRDYVLWQLKEQEKEMSREQESFWLKQFTGNIPVPLLPYDYVRPDVQSVEGSRLNFLLTRQQTGWLKDYCLKEDMTLFMVVLSVFYVLLSKLGGHEDIVVGTPVAGRRHADLEQVIGVFVNTLALRAYPAAGLSFRSFTKQVKKQTLTALENQDFPFENLVEQLEVPRDPGRNPLFDVAFVFQDFEVTKKNPQVQAQDHTQEKDEKPDGRVSKVRSYEYEEKTSKFDLTLRGYDMGNTLGFTFEYCTQLFKETTVKRFARYFKKIISTVIGHPQKRIFEIEMISEEEKRQFLVDFNRTEADYPTDKPLHQLFSEQAARTPGSIALDAHSLMVLHAPCALRHVISYRELSEKSNQLARFLKGKGVQTGTIVGIMVERSVEMIIGLLGILKAGGAYLPIDPESPEERLDFMLKDSSADLLVTRRGLTNQIEKLRKSEAKKDLEIGFLDFPGWTGSYPSTLPFSLPAHPLSHSPTQLSYIIYTSGSTGRPKGILVRHKGFVNLIYFHQKCFGQGEGTLMSQVVSPGFDAMGLEVWSCLSWGASLYIAPDEIRIVSATMKEWLIRNSIVISFQSTAVAEKLLKEEWSGQETALKILLTGGEQLKQFPARQFPFQLYNLYGPAEDTVLTTLAKVEVNTDQDIKKYPSIGKPIDNHRVYITNSGLQLQPVGVPGELCISGVGIAVGYLNNPELTAEKFNHDLWDLQDYHDGYHRSYRSHMSYITYKSYIYHTGDLARWSPDGNIEFLGRLDNQVKIRGFRIELGEIENRLMNYKGIEEAAVVSKERESGDKYLCAYIVSNKEIYLSELREHLSAFSPDYMIPAYFVKLDALPINTNGKIDRKALPEPDEIALVDRSKYETPRNEIEEKLTGIWEEVLGLERIGINDNFFLIGGDSIKAIQIIAKLRKTGYRIEMKDIFQRRRISELAPQVRKLKRTPHQAVIPGTVPLTPIQVEFFTDCKIDTHHFNQSVLLYLRKGFEKEIISAVFMKIQEHHDALRMTYRIVEGEVIQTNHGIDYPFSLQEYDLRNRQNPGAVFELICSRVQAGIDLENGPLMKLALFHMDDGDRLFIAVHHLVIDGVSWRILLEDVEILYRYYHTPRKDEAPPIPLKTDSFQYWSVRLQEYSRSKKFLGQLAYWRELETTTTAPLPVDHPVQPGRLKKKYVSSVGVDLSEEETRMLLKDVHRAYNTEINDILLTALALAINRWTGLENVLISLEGHGREEMMDDIDISRTIGWFTSRFPVILQVPQEGDNPDSPFLSAAVKNNKERLRKIPGKGIGYGILRYLTPSDKKEALTFTQEPGISFNYLGQLSRESTREPGLFTVSTAGTGAAFSPEQNTRYPLDINGMAVGNRLNFSFAYNRYQYHKNTIETLAHYYKEYLLEIIKHCIEKEEVEMTPSDYSIAGMEQEELENVYEALDGLVNTQNK
jgi:amino acid adenylation domain-containing protein/non-ribosomal peptide synthase protein (TIGR01720 family)